MSERVETSDAAYSLGFLEGTMRFGREVSQHQQYHIDRLALFIAQNRPTDEDENRPTDEDDSGIYIYDTGVGLRGFLDIHDCKRVIEEQAEVIRAQNKPSNEDDKWVYIDNTNAGVRGYLDINDCKIIIEEQAEIICRLTEEAKKLREEAKQ